MATSDQQGSTTPGAAAPVDKSQFIRTMAKDMAALSGAAAPAKPAAPKADERVVLPAVEESFWSKPQPKEFPQEVEALPTLEEAAAITEPAPIVPAPLPVPEPTDAQKSAILARLREKVGQSAQMSIQTSPAPAVPMPPPTPAKNEWPDIPTPAPQFAPAPDAAPVERIPPVVREPAPAPAETPQALHTFKSDFADRIDQKEASAFSVLAAQQDAAPVPVPQALPKQKRDNGRMIATIASGVVLLLLAIGGVYATYNFVMTMRNTPIAAISVPSIVFADEYKEVSGTGPELMNALAAAANEALVAGNVLVTYTTQSVAGEKGIALKTPAEGGVLIAALDLDAPDILLRNIAPESTVGIVHAGSETRPFFALRVQSYERTYAGMLTWEPLMLRSLAALYPLYPAESIPAPAVATTTATSTLAASTTPAASEPIQAVALTRFADAVVANHDVRVLRDTAGKSVLLYGYADKQTLIIARDETAFEILLSRLKAAE